ncbi:unnamed protein product [Urochloa humidicola]
MELLAPPAGIRTCATTTCRESRDGRTSAPPPARHRSSRPHEVMMHVQILRPLDPGWGRGFAAGGRTGERGRKAGGRWGRPGGWSARRRLAGLGKEHLLRGGHGCAVAVGDLRLHGSC